jgi:hypothetical protein
MRASTVIVFGASLLLAACSAAPAATPTPAPTVAPTPAPTATAVPSPAIPRLAAGNSQPGTYRTYQSDPQVLVTLPQGWGVYFDEVDGTYLNLLKAELLVGKSGDVIDPETGEHAPTPDVMAWLLEHPDLDATDPTPIVISGYQASYTDITTDQVVDIFYDPLGNFHLNPGVPPARFYVIPWDGPDMFIAVLPSPSGTFEEALEVGAPVAESVQFLP